MPILSLTNKGRQMTVDQARIEVCGGAISRQKLIDLFARSIGYKPGKAWVFFENELRDEWARHLESIRGRGRVA